MSFDIHEQRKFIRYASDFQVQVSFLEEPASSVRKTCTGLVKDISDAGFHIEVEESNDFSCGQHLDLSFQLQGNEEQVEPIEIEATVVWLDHNSPKEGLMNIGVYLNELLELGEIEIADSESCTAATAP